MAEMKKLTIGGRTYDVRDASVPDWAKSAEKPGYEPSELGLSSETWTFTLEDGTTVTKAVYIGELPKVKVTLTGQFNKLDSYIADEHCAYVVIGGKTYYDTYTTDVNEVLEVPVGTTIECYPFVDDCDCGSECGGYVYLNGAKVSEQPSNGSSNGSHPTTPYIYTIKSDVTIKATHTYQTCDCDDWTAYGDINITEQ